MVGLPLDLVLRHRLLYDPSLVSPKSRARKILGIVKGLSRLGLMVVDLLV